MPHRLATVPVLCLSLTACATPRPPATPPARAEVPRFEERPAPVVVESGRYSAVVARPTEEQADPLRVVVRIHLPDDLHTVGDAVAYLLGPSGYRLAPMRDRDTRQLLDLPLPRVHRTLGPMTAPVSVAAPVDIAAIDQWGSERQAVVRTGGRLRRLSEGDSVDGWTVEAIDGGRVIFRDARGRRAEKLR